MFVNRTPTTLPAAWPGGRRGAAITYDVARHKVVVFGGTGDSGAALSDTWEWDGATGTWTDRSPAVSPPAGAGAARMAFDSARKVALLFGGSFASSDPPYFWEWNGATGTWTERPPSTTLGSWPTSRYGPGVAYDSGRARMIIFGGYGPPDGELQDVWEWNASTGAWANRTPAVIPASWPGHRTGGFSFVYDPDRSVTVLFGGVSLMTNDDTSGIWEWNGMTGMWTSRGGGVSTQDPMVYDSDRRKMVTFLNSCQEAWDWEGATNYWTNRSPFPLPSMWPSLRSDENIAYDSLRRRVFMFGGFRNTPFQARDVWEWNGAE
jgi:hypothetical protein